MSFDRITTLELRQRNANNVMANGDYRTVLSKPITIEEGDEIVVTNSFLDTTVQTNASVNLDSDTDIEFEFLPWVNNLYVDGKLTNTPVKKDGMKHIPCKVDNHSGGKPGYDFVKFMTVTFFDDSSNYYGNYTVIFDYIDYNDQPQKISIYCPTSNANDLDPQVNVMGIIAKTGSVRLDPTMNLVVINSEPYNMKVSAQIIDPDIKPGVFGIITQPITDATSYNLVTFKKTITIPQGTYTPDLFADTITKLMTSNKQTSTNDISPIGVQNELLMGSNEFPPNEFTFVNAESSFAKDQDKAGSGFQYDGTIENAVWVGTNQFALEFDAPSNRYVLVSMHMPIYVNGNKCIVQFREGNIYPATGYSGISIVNITATNTETKQVIPQFAYNILGFQTGKLKPNITYVTGDVLDGGAFYPNLEFISGVNFTSAFNGIDARVSKDIGNTDQTAESDFTKVFLTNDIVSIVGESNDSIFGDNIFQSGTYTFGYYKIEINSKFSNLMIGEDTIQRNIMAIVSKYYESESYTDGVDGIPYIHKGAPVQLSEIGVRILNSDNVVPNILGDDNTIFIQITKAQQQPIQPTKK